MRSAQRSIDLARALDAERPERRVVLRRVEDDLAAVVRHRRPAVRGTSGRRSPPAPRARPGRTGSRPRAGSGGPGARRRRTCARPCQLVRRAGRRRVGGARRRSGRASRCAADRRDQRSRSDVLADRGARVGDRGRGRRRRRATSSRPAIRLRPRTPHFVWSATTTSRSDAATSARSVSASSRFGVVKPASALIPCTPRKSTSRCSERIAVDRDRPDERVRGRAHAAGEHDGQVGPRLAVEHVRDLDRVRDDGQVGHVREVVGEPPGRRAGGEADRLAGLDEPGGGAGDRLLLLQLAVRLRLEPGLLGAEAAAERGAAVHLLEQAGGGERVEVAADRHLGDGEQLGQLADAHGALAAELLDDQLLALGREHGSLGSVIAQYSTRTAQVPSRATSQPMSSHLASQRLDRMP